MRWKLEIAARTPPLRITIVDYAAAQAELPAPGRFERLIGREAIDDGPGLRSAVGAFWRVFHCLPPKRSRSSQPPGVPQGAGCLRGRTACAHGLPFVGGHTTRDDRDREPGPAYVGGTTDVGSSPRARRDTFSTANWLPTSMDSIAFHAVWGVTITLAMSSNGLSAGVGS